MLLLAPPLLLTPSPRMPPSEQGLPCPHEVTLPPLEAITCSRWPLRLPQQLDGPDGVRGKLVPGMCPPDCVAGEGLLKALDGRWQRAGVDGLEHGELDEEGPAQLQPW